MKPDAAILKGHPLWRGFTCTCDYIKVGQFKQKALKAATAAVQS